MKKPNYAHMNFVKVSAVSPQIFLAKHLENAKHILKLFKEEVKHENFIVSFPELSLTGYSCEDLFLTQELLNDTRSALNYLLEESLAYPSILIVGHPYQKYDGKLYNV